jgi:hypothetical protein
MSVAGIGVEGDIGDQADFRRGILHGLEGARDEPVRIERTGAGLVLAFGADIGKQRNCRDAEFPRADGRLCGILDAEPVNARQGADGDAVFALMHEDGPDQV